MISKLGATKKSIEIIARAKDDLMTEAPCGYTCLAQNPFTPERFVSSSQIIEDPDQGIHLWEVNPEAWASQALTNAKTTAPMKRQRT